MPEQQDQLRFLQTLLDAIPIPVFYKDSEGVYLGCNAAFEAYLGLPKDRIVGQTVFGVAPKDLAEVYRRADQDLLEQGGVQSYETAVRYGDGSWHDVIFNKATFAAKDGGVGGLIGTIIDISDRKRMAEVLHREQEFRALVENWPDVIARLDKSMRFLYVSPAFEKLTGVGYEDAVGKTSRELGMSPEKVRIWEANLAPVFDSGDPQTLDLSVPVANGTLYYERRAVPEFGPDGQIQSVLTWARDVTARRQAEEELRTANLELQKALTELRATQQQIVQSEKLTAIGTLAAGIAHELNNPLMGVLNYVAYGRRFTEDRKVQRVLDKADRELERMRALVRNMLGFARPVEEQVSQVSVALVLDRTLQLIRPEFKARKIAMVTNVADGLPDIQVKAGGLQQVLMNLLVNARDAVEACANKQVEVSVFQDDGDIRIEVADSGVGIAPELQSRVFDPFFTTKPPGKGTGLGLSLSRNIIRDMGGTLVFESVEQQGARFTIRLPIERGL